MDWIKVRIFSKINRYLVLKVLKVLQNSQGSRIFKVRIFLTGRDKYFTESCLPYCCRWLISELKRIELLLTESIFTIVFYILKYTHAFQYVIPKSIWFLPSFSDFKFFNAQHNVDLYMNWCLLKRPLFAANDDCRRKQYSRTWSFNWRKQKQVTFDLFNVSKTNDADLSCCSCFFWFSPVFGCPRYTALLTELLAPGAGK